MLYFVSLSWTFDGTSFVSFPSTFSCKIIKGLINGKVTGEGEATES